MIRATRQAVVLKVTKENAAASIVAVVIVIIVDKSAKAVVRNVHLILPHGRRRLSGRFALVI